MLLHLTHNVQGWDDDVDPSQDQGKTQQRTWQTHPTQEGISYLLHITHLIIAVKLSTSGGFCCQNMFFMKQTAIVFPYPSGYMPTSRPTF